MSRDTHTGTCINFGPKQFVLTVGFFLCPAIGRRYYSMPRGSCRNITYDSADLQRVLFEQDELRHRIGRLEEQIDRLADHLAFIAILETRQDLLENRVAALELLEVATVAELNRFLAAKEAGDDTAGDDSVGVSTEGPSDSVGVATEGNLIRPQSAHPWAVGAEVLGDEEPPPWDIDCIPIYQGRLVDPQEVMNRLSNMEVKPVQQSIEDQLDKVPFFLTASASASVQPNSSKPVQQKPAEDSAEDDCAEFLRAELANQQTPAHTTSSSGTDVRAPFLFEICYLCRASLPKGCKSAYCARCELDPCIASVEKGKCHRCGVSIIHDKRVYCAICYAVLKRQWGRDE